LETKENSTRRLITVKAEIKNDNNINGEEDKSSGGTTIAHSMPNAATTMYGDN
jgi:hypothetical protein